MSERSEPATPKKLADARKRGEVWKSREFSASLGFLVATALLPWLAIDMWLHFRELWHLVASSVALTQHLDDQTPSEWLQTLGFAVGHALEIMLPWLAAVTLISIGATFAQVGPLFSPQAIRIDANRLSPVANAKNVFSKKQLVEIAKSLLKVLWIGAAGYALLYQFVPSYWATRHGTLAGAVAVSLTAMKSLALRVSAGLLALGILDVLYQRHTFLQQQRMSKDETKREHKDSEGDPQTKEARERLRHEILMHNSLEAARSADVLIVNPTHLAIALRFDQEGEQDAPEVLGKGQDELAQRMIEAAVQSGVPVMQDVPLAHGLYALDLGAEIPAELYEAVAAVLTWAWQQQRE